MRLIPRDGAVLEDLGVLASHLVAGAELLARLLGADAVERADLADRASDLERRADADARAVVRRVASSFVTPYDPSDLVALATALDDCVDALEDAAAVFVTTGVDELPPAAVEQVALVQRQAEVTAEAMGRLRSVRDLADYWTEVRRLEHEAGRAHRTVIAGIFAGAARGERGTVELLAVKEVTDHLEAAADAFERVARRVELIAAKES